MYGSHFGFRFGSPSTGRLTLGGGGTTVPPTRALINSFVGTGLLDALLVPAPNLYTNTGSAPSVLVDALGGPIYYTSPSTDANTATVLDASGYTYLNANGTNNTLVASANQTVSYYCAVLRSPPGQTTWSNYGPPLGIIGTSSIRDLFQPDSASFIDAGDFQPRAVSRNGTVLSAPYNLSPVATWMLISVHSIQQFSTVLELFDFNNSFPTKMHLAALGVRYSDPTSDQQTQIESRLAPMRDALLAASSPITYALTLSATNASGTGTQNLALTLDR